MLTPLRTALPGLLKSALPDIFAGDPPAIGLELPVRGWTLAPLPADPLAGVSAPEEAVDAFGIAPAHPEGPYRLSRQPLSGPRRVCLLLPSGDRRALAPDEFAWTAETPPAIVLHLPPKHPWEADSRLEATYPAATESARILIVQEFAIRLTAEDPAFLERAVSLTLAFLSLNEGTVRAAGADAVASGIHQAGTSIRSLRLKGCETPAEGIRQLIFEADVEFRATRNRLENGHPITRIRSPGASGKGPIQLAVSTET